MKMGVSNPDRSAYYQSAMPPGISISDCGLRFLSSLQDTRPRGCPCGRQEDAFL